MLFDDEKSASEDLGDQDKRDSKSDTTREVTIIISVGCHRDHPNGTEGRNDQEKAEVIVSVQLLLQEDDREEGSDHGDEATHHLVDRSRGHGESNEH